MASIHLSQWRLSNTICAYAVLLWLCVAMYLLLAVSCGTNTTNTNLEARVVADSLVKAADSDNALDSLKKIFAKQGNILGQARVLREQGRRARNESRFDTALQLHSQGLELAEAARDTLEIVQTLNNIGTNYRRLGILDAAAEYHQRALYLSEEQGDTTTIGKKNRVMALNGLGNVYMTLGNHERADSVLREALKGEKQLGSATGQAINYGNLGNIYEQQGLYDSAWYYYRCSMAYNRAAKNTLGIALCHTYYGSLYEKEQHYDKAIAEYNAADSTLRTSKDEWHILNIQLALARVYIATQQPSAALHHLHTAEQVAKRIKSTEHSAEIHLLYYQLHQQQGNYQAALAHHVRATALQDSVVDMNKLNHIQHLSLSIERRRQAQQIELAEQRIAQEQRTKHTNFVTFLSITLAALTLTGLLIYILRLRTRSHRALKQLSQMRETFFTNITHELRTPLTVILGLGQDLVQDKAVPETIQTKAHNIVRQGNILLELINQLLDIAKLKAAISEPEWRHGDLAAYVAMIVESYQDYANSKHLTLSYEMQDMVAMDFVPDYITKILNNLISNAIKYTHASGSICIRIVCHDERATISVSDTGIGIAPEALKHVFEPFYQVNHQGQYLGTGVGLALVQQAASAMGGSVQVESSLGVGSTFSVSLPMKYGHSQWPAPKPLTHWLHRLAKHEAAPTESLAVEANTTHRGTASDSDNERPRVLIIEDHHDVAQYIGSQLTTAYDVCYASNGQEGLNIAHENVPDLVITDLMMPELDGLSVCRALRGNELTSHVPIIVVTAKVTEADRIEGLRVGADAYMGKPFNGDELRIRVANLLEQRRHLREKYAQATQLLPSTQTLDANQPLSDTQTRHTATKAEELFTALDHQFLNKTTDAILVLMEQRSLSVNTLAERLCISQRQLHRKLIALTGESPTAYILRIKMQRAKLLIEKPNQLSIEEIAAHCGFEHYSGFYHAFKKTYGVSPTTYKKQLEN